MNHITLPLILRAWLKTSVFGRFVVSGRTSLHSTRSALSFFFLTLLILLPTSTIFLPSPLSSPSKVYAQTPNTTISFQARILNSSGSLVPDGNYHIEFKIYDTVSSGATAQGTCTGNCLWMETRTTGNLVRVVNGYVAVNLGSVTAFPSTIPWSQDLYVTMRVGGTTGPVWDSEMVNVPAGNTRMKLNAVPLAFVANNVRSSIRPSGTATDTIAVQTGNATNAASGAININSGTTTTSGASGNVTIGTGNSAGNSGNLSLDVGTAVSTAGTITIGGTNVRSFTLGNTNAATVLNLLGGSTTNGINIGSVGASTAASTISIGTTTNATGIQLLTLGSTAANASNRTTIQGGSSTTAGAEAIRILPATAGAIAIGSTTGTGTIILGQSTAGQAITIGNANNTVAQTIQIGNGLSGANSTVSILSGVGTAGAGTLNLGNNTRVTGISLGNINPAAARTISIGNTTGTGNAVIDTINIATNPTTVAGGNTVNIATGTPTGAGSNLVTIGSTALASALNLRAGTGNINLGASLTQFTEVTGTRTLGVQTRTTNVAGTNLTIAGGTAGAGAAAFSGGTLTLQGGNAGGTGNANGANVILAGGTGVGTGIAGNVQFGSAAGWGAILNNGATLNTTLVLGNFAANGAIGTAVATVDVYTSISIAQTTGSISLTVPTPTNATGYGRTIYISNIGTASVNINTVALPAGSTATLVWSNTNGGASWQFAGLGAGGGGTTLQTAYNASGATEITLDNTRGGLTVRDNSTPITGNLLEVQNNGGGTTYLGVSTSAINLGVNTTLAAGQTLRVVGGNTGSRPTPVAGNEGSIYYDTDTNQLLVVTETAPGSGTYSWQADRTDAILVAASNSSQADKDAADYVGDGNTGAANDGDQVEINAALTAAAGRKVVLLAGTYTVDASISVPNSTTLVGVGAGTVITIPNALNVFFSAIVNTDTFTGRDVTLRDFVLNGNSANQSGAVGMTGIDFNNMGGGTGTTARPGAKIMNIQSNNWYSGTGIINCQGGLGICLRNSSYGSVVGNTTQGNSVGIFLATSTNTTITANTTQANTNSGIYLSSSSTNNTVTANSSRGDGVGIQIFSNTNTITGNAIQGSTTNAISINTGNNNVISDNQINDSGGATNNNGISLTTADFNQIISNSIIDTSCSTTCTAITITNVASDKNYLEGNRFTGSAANVASINDAGTGTIYAGQQTNTTTSTNSDVSDFRFRGSADSATAFSIQNASGNSVLNIDTADFEVELGNGTNAGELMISDGTANFVKITASGVGANYTLTLPTAVGVDGDCLKQTGATGSLIFGSCGAASGTLQGAYTASTGGTTPEIILDSTRSTLDIQDRSTSNGGSLNTNLISIRATAANDTTLGTQVFGVTSTGQTSIRTTTDSVSAFTLQNASGNNILQIDTLNRRLVVGQTSSANWDSMKVLTPMDTEPTGQGNATSYSPDGVYMSVAHTTTPFVTIYKRYGDDYVKLPDPATLPTGTGNGVSFSPDGVYMSVAHTTSPFVTIYKIDKTTDTFTKLTNPATLPASTGNDVSFSSDGLYMSVAHTTSPFVTIYKIDKTTDTFTKLTNPATLPASTGNDVSFSSDGLYMSVAHTTTPFITIYKINRATDTFTKLTDPATLPTGTGNGVSFSPDGVYMSVAHTTTPFITIYKINRATDTFTKLTDPAVLPGSNGFDVTFSLDGKYMAVGHAAIPYVNLYRVDRITDTFTKLADDPTGQLVGNVANSLSFSPDGRSLAVAHPLSSFISIYRINATADTLTRMTVPTISSTGAGNATSYSPDGVYMSVAHTTTPFVTIYKRYGDDYVKLPDPATLPTGTGNGVSFSPDGVYMSVAHTTSPFVTIYKIDKTTDTFTKLTNPATLPASTGNDVSFSSDGLYMSVAHTTSPFVTIYKIDKTTDTFTKLTNPATLPASTGNDVSFSSDGLYMSVAHTTTPFITIYKINRATDTFTKLTDPATLPTGTGNGVSFSPDGVYMSVAHTTSPFVTIYKIDKTTDTFTKLTNPATLPASTGNDVSFSSDGLYMSVAHTTSPYITVYGINRTTDTFTKILDSPTLASGNAFGVSFSRDGTHMVLTHVTQPYITIYKATGGLGSGTELVVRDRALIEGSLTVGNISASGLGLAINGSVSILEGTLSAEKLQIKPQADKIDSFNIQNAGGLSLLSADTKSNLIVVGSATEALWDDAEIVGPFDQGLGNRFTNSVSPQSISFSPSAEYVVVTGPNGANARSSRAVAAYKKYDSKYVTIASPEVSDTISATSSDFSPDGLMLAIGINDYPYINIFKVNTTTDAFTKMPDPSVLPTGSVRDVAFSEDGQYMSVAHDTSPFVTIYKVNQATNTFSKISNPAVLPAGFGNSVEFSPDTLYMTVGHATTPFMTTYKIDRATNTFTKITDPAVLPPDEVEEIDYDPLGTYIAVGTPSVSPYLRIYKIDRTTDSFTSLTVPSLGGNTVHDIDFSPNGQYVTFSYTNGVGHRTYEINRQTDSITTISSPSISSNTVRAAQYTPDGLYLATSESLNLVLYSVDYTQDRITAKTSPGITAGDTSNGNDLAFSPDDTYMAVAESSSPFVTIYKRYGDDYVKLPDPATLPTGTGNGVSFSPDGVYMSVAHTTSPFVTIYKIDKTTDTFTKLTNPATLPASTGNDVSFSSDGLYMSVAHTTSPFVTIYKIDKTTDTFTKLTNPATLPASTGNDVSFSSDGLYMSVAHTTTPFITIYKINRATDTFTKLTDPATLPTGTGNGVSFSPDGVYMSVAHDITPFVTVYRINKLLDTFTKIANPATLPLTTSTGVDFSQDGRYMVLGILNTSSSLDIYKIDQANDRLDEIFWDASALPIGFVNSVQFANKSKLFAIGSNLDSHKVILIKASGGTSKVNLQISNGALISDSIYVDSASVGVISGGSGNLIVSGNVTFEKVSSADLIKMRTDLQVAGPALFMNEVNSTSAFTVQDASGTALLDINTSDKIITVGSKNTEATWEKSFPLGPLDSDFVYEFGATVTGLDYSDDGRYLGVTYTASAQPVTIFLKTGDDYSKISSLPDLPSSGTAQSVQFSPDGKYLTIGWSSSPYVLIYSIDRTTNTFTKLTNPSNLPTGSVTEISFSRNGKYMSLAHNTSPFITIYTINSFTNTFTKLTDPATLPTGNATGVDFSPDDLYMSVSHTTTPFVTIYKVNSVTNTFTKLTDPATLPTGNATETEFSENGQYMAVTHSTSPYVTIYKITISTDTFTKLANPATLPTAVAQSLAFSPDGRYMVVGHDSNSPYMRVYSINNTVDSFTSIGGASPNYYPYELDFSPDSKHMASGVGVITNDSIDRKIVTIYTTESGFSELSEPKSLPNTTDYVNTSASYSYDGSFMAVGTNQSPYIAIYKKNGESYEKITNPVDSIPGSASGVAFSPNGEYLAVSHSTSPFVTVFKYDLSSGYFYKIANPDVLPTGTGQGVSFSKDGNYLAVAHSTSPFVSMYRLSRAGDTLTKIANPATLPTGTGYSTSFSPDLNYLTVTHATSPFVSIYKIDKNAGTLTKIANPATLPTGTAYGSHFSPDGLYLAVSHATTPFLTIYKVDSATDTFTKLANPSTIPSGTSYASKFSRDGNYLVVVADDASVADFFYFYRIDRGNDSFTWFASSLQGIRAVPTGLDFSLDNTHLTMVTSSSNIRPGILILKAYGGVTQSKLVVNSDLFLDSKAYISDLRSSNSDGLIRVNSEVNFSDNVRFGSGVSTGSNLTVGARSNSGGTTADWEKISQTTAGTISSSGTTAIDQVRTSVVFNGSLYIGTSDAGGAEVYRYDGGTTWTKVSNATAGTIAGGGTTGITTVRSMIVHDGKLYIGTSKTAQAEVYRYDGGTTWTKVSNATAGTIAGGGTAGIYDVTNMVVWNGNIYAGTYKPGGGAEVYRYDGGTTWTKVSNATAGTIAGGGTLLIESVEGMVVHNGTMYIGTYKINSAEVYRYDGGTTWTKVSNATAGTIAGGGTAGIESVESMAVFNGAIYVGTSEGNLAEVYRYDGGTTWTKVSNATAGTIAGGGTAGIDIIRAMRVYNGSLYAGTYEPGAAEVYRYESGTTWTKVSDATAGTIITFGTSTIDQVMTMIVYGGRLIIGTGKASSGEVISYSSLKGLSYALQFQANSNTTSGSSILQNTASIVFSAEEQATSNQGNTGSFLFSHGISSTAGSYDVAEDYPTRDDSLVAGEIVILDVNERGFVKKSDGTKYDNKAVGIYSTNPALRLSQKDATIDGGRAVPIALAGRVPVKVTNENGVIQPGDYITTSSRPGYGMKATQYGQVIGKALEGFSGEEGTVLVFINVTNYVPDTGYVLEEAVLGNLSVTETLTAQSVFVEDIAVSGNLTVNGLATISFLKVTNGIEFGGKITSVGEVPTITFVSTVNGEEITDPTITVDVTGTDVAGIIKLISQDYSGDPYRLKLVFSNGYEYTPVVTLSPNGREGALLGSYIEGGDLDGVYINFISSPEAGKTYQFNYQIIEAKTTEVAGSTSP